MPMNPRLLPFLLLLICSPVALAQTSEETTVEEEPLRIYDVEIILFKNLQGPRGLEYIRPSLLPTRAETVVEIQSNDSLQAAAEIGYQLLQQDEFKLIEQVEKIINSPRYELMLHAAWRQPGLELEESTPVWIRGGNLYGNEYSSIDFRAQNYPGTTQAATSVEGGVTETGVDENSGDENSLVAEQNALNAILNPDSDVSQQVSTESAAMRNVNGAELYELEGKITVSLARFLHVNADLVFRKPRPVGTSQVGMFNNPLTTPETSKILENHRLQERRRMRSSRLHYLDSPHFSMLVMITPYEVEEDPVEVEDAAEGEAVSVTPLTE